MHHVFISYSRLDMDVVRPIVADLRRQDVRVWVDESSIPASIPWRDEITSAIAGAALFVRCGSPAWDRSEVCRSELEDAERFGKCVLSIDPRGDRSRAVAQVGSALTGMPGEFRRSTELLVAARAWETSGRRRGLLAGRQLLTRAKAALRATKAAHVPSVREFVARSRRRLLFQRVSTVVATAVGVAAVIALAFLPGVAEELSHRVALNALVQGHDHKIAQFEELEPYVALDALVDDGDGRTYASDLRLLSMVATPWPSESADATLDAAADATVSVEGASAHTTGTGDVEVRDALGALVRRIGGGAGVVGLAWSPDGRLLAVAHPAEIQIVNVRSGLAVLTLPVGLGSVVSPAEGFVEAIDWDESGRLVADTRDHGVVEWDLSARLPTAISSDAWVISGTAIGDGEDSIVVLRDGRLARVAPSGGVVAERDAEAAGAIVRVYPSDTRDEVTALRRSASGPDELLVVDVELEVIASYSLPEQCLASGFATTPTRYVVACGNGLMVSIERATGTVSTAVNEISAVGVAVAGERVFVRDQLGTVAELGADMASASIIPSFVCVTGLLESMMAHLPMGDQILVAGPGTAGGCRAHTYDVSSRTFHSMTFAWVERTRSQALAVSPDGAHAAYGFDDGTVWMVASDGENAYERAVNRDLGAAVRSLAFSSDGTSLVAISVDGRIVEIPISDDPIADAQREAMRILADARAAGWIAE